MKPRPEHAPAELPPNLSGSSNDPAHYNSKGAIRRVLKVLAVALPLATQPPPTPTDTPANSTTPPQQAEPSASPVASSELAGGDVPPQEHSLTKKIEPSLILRAVEEQMPLRRAPLSFPSYLHPPVAVSNWLELMLGTLPRALSLAKRPPATLAPSFKENAPSPFRNPPLAGQTSQPEAAHIQGDDAFLTLLRSWGQASEADRQVWRVVLRKTIRELLSLYGPKEVSSTPEELFRDYQSFLQQFLNDLAQMASCIFALKDDARASYPHQADYDAEMYFFLRAVADEAQKVAYAQLGEPARYFFLQTPLPRDFSCT
ncbi:MAG: hypothetical protein KatS3mg099_355 [Candidatus Parcubacteria bacterium]|nr:MAG: hypothetical protein KatS3mg099_355 [Candidatus Parcubacteria bacterium]